MKFYKFDANGNDFILADIRENDPRFSKEEIAYLCHRRYGIGADGFMTLGCAEGYDFEMRYYNSDGALGSMCGNGGRCIIAFARYLDIEPSGNDGMYHFLAYDGPHDGEILDWSYLSDDIMAMLCMKDVEAIERVEEGWFLDTGSPHFVLPVNNVKQYDVYGEGKKWRERTDLFPQGTNVDFIELQPDGTLFVRTYERGVEDETYSCGTGVTAAALVYATQLQTMDCEEQEVELDTKGGDFFVSFCATPQGCKEIRLVGGVNFNFEAEIDYKSKHKLRNIN